MLCQASRYDRLLTKLVSAKFLQCRTEHYNQHCLIHPLYLTHFIDSLCLNYQFDPSLIRPKIFVYFWSNYAGLTLKKQLKFRTCFCRMYLHHLVQLVLDQHQQRTSVSPHSTKLLSKHSTTTTPVRKIILLGTVGPVLSETPTF